MMRRIVTDRLAWSVYHTSEPYESVGPTKMPFGLWIWVGPGNYVSLLDRGPDPRMGRDNLEGERGVEL